MTDNNKERLQVRLADLEKLLKTYMAELMMAKEHKRLMENNIAGVKGGIIEVKRELGQ